MERVLSNNKVPIRLTEERWIHIVENHDDLAGHYDDFLDTVENPDMIVQGFGEALMAIKEMERNSFLAVVYKETTHEDGFIITSYFTSKITRRSILWRKTKE